MSRKCSICNRGPQTSVSRTHSNIANKTKQYLNLQTKKILGKKMKLCTKCLKNFKKKK